jgi:hypothetical protein
MCYTFALKIFQQERARLVKEKIMEILKSYSGQINRGTTAEAVHEDNFNDVSDAIVSSMCKSGPCSLLAEARAAYDELLEDAICLYQHYPNNFRKTVGEYFKKEIEIQKKLSKHFDN